MDLEISFICQLKFIDLIPKEKKVTTVHVYMYTNTDVQKISFDSRSEHKKR